MIDISTPFDTQYVFTYLLFAAIVGGGAYGVSKLVGGKVCFIQRTLTTVYAPVEKAHCEGRKRGRDWR